MVLRKSVVSFGALALWLSAAGVLAISGMPAAAMQPPGQESRSAAVPHSSDGSRHRDEVPHEGSHQHGASQEDGPGVSLPARPLGSDRRTLTLTTVYCVLIVMASVIGGWLPAWIELTHTRMQTVISFVGGLMLGIAVFHLLPHSTHGLPSIDHAATWMMVGIVSMFLLIRMFHFHHHGPLEISPAHEDADAVQLADGQQRDGFAILDSACHHSAEDHTHDHDHDHDHDHTHAPRAQASPAIAANTTSAARTKTQIGSVSGPPCHHAHQLSWLGIAIGLSIHTLIDGVALAASVQAESAHSAWLSLFGLGTFLAVMLHKPLDAVSITSLMAASGWPSRSRSIVNAAFAMMCPLGALLFLVGASQLHGWQAAIVGAALAFSAGVFICISLSDLLPEMEFHAHNRLSLTTALACGIGLAWGITFLEPSHLH